MDPVRWKSIIDKASGVLLHGWNVNNRNYVLDPLTCLIRLAMISHLPVGTKISIQQNRVTYNHASIFQGPVRWVSGDTRDDLHNLHNPLQKITLWYHVDSQPFQYLLAKAIEGLRKVKNSYPQQSIITHTLDHYIGILEKSVTSTRNADKSLEGFIMRDAPLEDESQTLGSVGDKHDGEKHKNSGGSSVKKDTNEAQETDLRENLLYQSFKNLWNNRQLKTIYFLFQELDCLESKSGDDGIHSQKQAYIQSIETILDMKENIVTHFITRVTTVL